MANAFYDIALQYFARGEINWLASGGDDFRAFLIDLAQYTPNMATHDFLDDVPTAARKGGSGTGYNQGVALTEINPAATGIIDANDITFTAVAAGAAVGAILIYKAGTSDADSRLIALLDGKFRFTIAAAASSGATALTVDPLEKAIASGAVAAKISGAGGSVSTFTLSAGASANARSLSISALGAGGVAVGDVYEVTYSGAGLPITPNGGDINVTLDATYGVGRI